MKKIYTLLAACTFAVIGAHAETVEIAEASSEAVASEAIAPAPEAAPAQAVVSGFEVPDMIAEHLSVRLPGSTVKGIVREGATYYVDLGNGSHVRYDACFNPICYGHHDHECQHEDEPALN